MPEKALLGGAGHFTPGERRLGLDTESALAGARGLPAIWTPPALNSAVERPFILIVMLSAIPAVGACRKRLANALASSRQT